MKPVGNMMQIQTIQPEYAAPRAHSASAGQKNPSTPENFSHRAEAGAYAYQSQSFGMIYTNQDGDRVELFYKQEQFEAVTGRLYSESAQTTSPFSSAFQRIKDFIEQQEQQLLAHFFGNNDNSMIQKVMNGSSVAVQNTPELKIPEFWNAENTSQRIVDFALSFYSFSDKSPEEYAKMMKNAVKAGFEQAGAVLGERPSEVEALVSQTEKLAMEKFDRWIQEQSYEPVSLVA